MSDKKPSKKKPVQKKSGLIGTDKIKAVKAPVQAAANRSRGLGRGLDSLIKPQTPAPAPAPVVPEPPKSEEKFLEVPIAQIDRSPWQARSIFNEETIAELAASIEENGIITPLSCRRLASGRYELVYGERRLRAAQLAGWTKIRVTLVEADDITAAAMTTTENLQREDLNPMEEAEGYQALMNLSGMTQEQVAQKVGKSRPSVANALRLLNLPEQVSRIVRAGGISAGADRYCGYSGGWCENWKSRVYTSFSRISKIIQ